MLVVPGPLLILKSGNLAPSFWVWGCYHEMKREQEVSRYLLRVFQGSPLRYTAGVTDELQSSVAITGQTTDMVLGCCLSVLITQPDLSDSHPAQVHSLHCHQPELVSLRPRTGGLQRSGGVKPSHAPAPTPPPPRPRALSMLLAPGVPT